MAVFVFLAQYTCWVLIYFTFTQILSIAYFCCETISVSFSHYLLPKTWSSCFYENFPIKMSGGAGLSLFLCCYLWDSVISFCLKLSSVQIQDKNSFLIVSYLKNVKFRRHIWNLFLKRMCIDEVLGLDQHLICFLPVCLYS